MRARRGKFNARRTTCDGVTFASKKEARRYSELKLLERAGLIKDLRLQVKYPLVVNGAKIADYVADFVFWDCKAKREIVEDSKGFLTRVYVIKRRLMLALYGITILET